MPLAVGLQRGHDDKMRDDAECQDREQLGMKRMKGWERKGRKMWGE